MKILQEMDGYGLCGMQEREHTLEELRKLEKVRNFLLSEGACDMDGFYDLIQNKR